MAIFERGETYSHWVTIRDRDNTKVDPNTVVIDITGPCGSPLVNSQAMTKNATGEYYYNYDTIDSSATYGKYGVKVTSTSASGQVGIQEDEFYVMPWKLQKDVRQVMGISETKDINDDDLSDICWKTYQEGLRDVYIRHYRETPKGDPNTGNTVNGSNTKFQTKHWPIADINGDGLISGNATSCATDIDCWWINSQGSRKRAIVAITNYLNGEITITQSDGSSAIPANSEGLYVTYWHEHHTFDDELFRSAVAHLAADMVMRRLKEIDRVTAGDLATNNPIIVKDSNRFFRKYKMLMGHIRKPMCGGI